jgi:hypothetical protein
VQEEWLDATFEVVDSEISEMDWFNNNPPTFEKPTIFLVKSSYQEEKAVAPSWNIFLRCPHDTADGIGILQLLN